MKKINILLIIIMIVLISAAAVIGIVSVNVSEKNKEPGFGETEDLSEIIDPDPDRVSLYKAVNQSRPGGSWSERIRKIIYWFDLDGALMRDFDDQINVDINDLTVYDYKKYLNYCPFVVSRESSSAINELCLMNSAFPIEYLIKISDSKICAVYKFKYGELDPTYCFVIFEKHNITKNDMLCEEWVRTGEKYCINRLYTDADFDDIRPGYSAKSVFDMDIGASYDNINRINAVYTDSGYSFEYDENITERQYYRDVYWKPLSEGVLCITCEKDAGPDPAGGYDHENYTVTEVKLYEYGDEIFNKGYETNVYEIFRCLENVFDK